MLYQTFWVKRTEKNPKEGFGVLGFSRIPEETWQLLQQMLQWVRASPSRSLTAKGNSPMWDTDMHDLHDHWSIPNRLLRCYYIEPN